MNKIKEIFKGVFSDEKRLYTKESTLTKNPFNEKKIKFNNSTLREWNPYRSKLSAAIKSGIKIFPINKNSKMLYLGSAEGQTVLHVSDIIGKNGLIFCVDVSTIAMQKLTKLSETRENILPILSDANVPSEYKEFIEEKVDSIFIDVSQRNQIEIFLKNSVFLKKNGWGGISLKTRSISQSKKTSEILNEEKEKLEKDFFVEQIINLEPFEKEHYFILVRKK